MSVITTTRGRATYGSIRDGAGPSARARTAPARPKATASAAARPRVDEWRLMVLPPSAPIVYRGRSTERPAARSIIPSHDDPTRPRADPSLGDGLADRRRRAGLVAACQLDPRLPLRLPAARGSAGPPSAGPAGGGPRAETPARSDRRGIARRRPGGGNGRRARPAAVDRDPAAGWQRGRPSRERRSAGVLRRGAKRPLPQPRASLSDHSRSPRRGRGGGLFRLRVRPRCPPPSADPGTRPLDRDPVGRHRGDRGTARRQGRLRHLAHSAEPRHQLHRRPGPARDRRDRGPRLSLLRARAAAGAAAGDRAPGAV